MRETTKSEPLRRHGSRSKEAEVGARTRPSTVVLAPSALRPTIRSALTPPTPRAHRDAARKRRQSPGAVPRRPAGGRVPDRLFGSAPATAARYICPPPETASRLHSVNTANRTAGAAVAGV